MRAGVGIVVFEVGVFQPGRLDDTGHVGAIIEHFQDLGTGHLADHGCVAERQDGEHVAVGQQALGHAYQLHSRA